MPNWERAHVQNLPAAALDAVKRILIIWRSFPLTPHHLARRAVSSRELGENLGVGQCRARKPKRPRATRPAPSVSKRASRFGHTLHKTSPTMTVRTTSWAMTPPSVAGRRMSRMKSTTMFNST